MRARIAAAQVERGQPRELRKPGARRKVRAVERARGSLGPISSIGQIGARLLMVRSVAPAYGRKT
ncbi:MAG TPA: hypothetical protein VEQ11_07410 [Chloroflexota bacterium]|nr:hypothetical protein [Chloroflexota bacterium]